MKCAAVTFLPSQNLSPEQCSSRFRRGEFFRLLDHFEKRGRDFADIETLLTIDCLCLPISPSLSPSLPLYLFETTIISE